jgi:hypothetical protein
MFFRQARKHAFSILCIFHPLRCWHRMCTRHGKEIHLAFFSMYALLTISISRNTPCSSLSTSVFNVFVDSSWSLSSPSSALSFIWMPHAGLGAATSNPPPEIRSVRFVSKGDFVLKREVSKREVNTKSNHLGVSEYDQIIQVVAICLSCCMSVSEFALSVEKNMAWRMSFFSALVSCSMLAGEFTCYVNKKE